MEPNLYPSIRGSQASDPILLWLHGGSGGAERPLFRYFNSELEKHFVAAHWDQRGAGRSFSPVTEAIYPSILHQDPRYFRRSSGSVSSRFGYAIGQIFWTHTDAGRMQFNFSEIVGNSTVVAIATSY